MLRSGAWVLIDVRHLGGAAAANICAPWHTFDVPCYELACLGGQGGVDGYVPCESEPTLPPDHFVERALEAAAGKSVVLVCDSRGPRVPAAALRLAAEGIEAVYLVNS